MRKRVEREKIDKRRLLEILRENFTPSFCLNYPDDPVIVTKGRDATLIDIDGREYIDCYTGLAVNAWGQCHPKIVKAIQSQAAELGHISKCIPSVPIIKLADKIVRIAPSRKLKRIHWGVSGSDGVEAALTMAKRYTKGTEIIGLFAGYHGASSMVKPISGVADSRKGAGPFPSNIYSIPSYYCYRCWYRLEYPECGLLCAKILRDIIEVQTSKEVAAFIAEPILGNAGIVVPPKDYFIEIKKVLHEYGILFVDDEVLVGLGKTGQWWGIEHWGVNPDIMVAAKSIGGGLSLAATVTSDEIAAMQYPSDNFASTAANPIAAAAALAGIEVTEQEKLLERASRLGQYFLGRLKGLQEKHEILGDVRGKGLLLAMEFVKSRQTKEPAIDEAIQFTVEVKKRGVLITQFLGGLGASPRILPPMIITKEQINMVVDVFDEALKAIKIN